MSSDDNVASFRLDFDKNSLLSNFSSDQWIRCYDDQDWNFYWASVTSVKAIFNPDIGYRLKDNQIINHFPNHYELTNKDLMVKHIKKYKKECEKQYQNSDVLDFVPQSFILPTDYALFVDEYRNNPKLTWIMKPCRMAQGKGITIITKLSQLRKLELQQQRQTSRFTNTKENFLISRYIDNPLLIGGKKFDLRLFVLVTNSKPLAA